LQDEARYGEDVDTGTDNDVTEVDVDVDVDAAVEGTGLEEAGDDTAKRQDEERARWGSTPFSSPCTAWRADDVVETDAVRHVDPACPREQGSEGARAWWWWGT
jgi:hypothetical protein